MNCKPGDLAYIVGNFPEAGYIVECLELTPKQPHWPEYGAFWYCKSVRPIECEYTGFRRDIVVPDKFLRPISGVPLNDEVTDDLEVTA